MSDEVNLYDNAEPGCVLINDNGNIKWINPQSDPDKLLCIHRNNNKYNTCIFCNLEKTL